MTATTRLLCVPIWVASSTASGQPIYAAQSGHIEVQPGLYEINAPSVALPYRHGLEFEALFLGTPSGSPSVEEILWTTHDTTYTDTQAKDNTGNWTLGVLNVRSRPSLTSDLQMRAVAIPPLEDPFTRIRVQQQEVQTLLPGFLALLAPDALHAHTTFCANLMLDVNRLLNGT